MLKKVPLFAGLNDRELQEIASSMRERRFKAGDTVTQEGSGGVGFFVVEQMQNMSFCTGTWPFGAFQY